MVWASAPTGQPPRDFGFQPKMSKWTQPRSGANRCRNRAAVTEPAWAQASGSFLRSEMSPSTASASQSASLPMSLIVTKEIDLIGTFRFHAEFALAVETIAHRRIDVRPLLTEVVPLSDAVRAFELAADRTRAMKVQLGFD